MEIVRRFERALARGACLEKAARANTEQRKSLDQATNADTEQPKLRSDWDPCAPADMCKIL